MRKVMRGSKAAAPEGEGGVGVNGSGIPERQRWRIRHPRAAAAADPKMRKAMRGSEAAAPEEEREGGADGEGEQPPAVDGGGVEEWLHRRPEQTADLSSVDAFESVIDSSKLLEACRKVNPVNECCSQTGLFNCPAGLNHHPQSKC